MACRPHLASNKCRKMLHASTFFRTRSVTDSPLSCLCAQQFRRTLCYCTCPKSGSIAPRVNLFSDTFSNTFSVELFVCSTIQAHPLLLNVSEIRFKRSTHQPFFPQHKVVGLLFSLAHTFLPHCWISSFSAPAKKHHIIVVVVGPLLFIFKEENFAP